MHENLFNFPTLVLQAFGDRNGSLEVPVVETNTKTQTHGVTVTTHSETAPATKRMFVTIMIAKIREI